MSSPNLVPFDCADSEINSQLASSLDVLRRSVDEMIDKSTRKMAQFEDRLHSYSRRFEVLKKKLEVLKTTDAQPLITSPAEFPGKIHVGRSLVFRKLEERESSQNIEPKATGIFDHLEKQKPIKDMILRKNGYCFVFPKGKHNEALQFKDSERDQSTLLSNFDQKHRGFVRPERLYEFTNGLNDNSHKKTVEMDGQLENGESLLIFESLAAQEAADPFTYKPGAGNLTDFDLPEDLPQLTGIAKNIFTSRESLFGFDNTAVDDDEIFSGTSQRHGNSDFTGSNMFYVFEKNIDQRSLNSRVSFTPTPDPSMLSNTRPTDSLSLNAPSSASSEKESTNSVAPLVSPPVQIQQPIAAPRPSVAVSSNCPAPPAPPPPPIQLLSSIPSPPMPSGRSDLMEAIRAAGGASKAKLKKVAQKEDDEETEIVSVRPSASDGGEDLMASLTKALQKRRKVIAGGNSARKFDALEQKRKPPENATFSTLREIIPPPSHCPDSDDGGNEEDWK
ncbi:WH2 domain-containing protein [Aphelenchoides besseyi]|nr:WH2 domain-containing protein [Aphelenchoides besseyi]KAI6194966.1 WH2 domain-containing protein [Aphelenchoides besseyi]